MPGAPCPGYAVALEFDSAQAVADFTSLAYESTGGLLMQPVRLVAVTAVTETKWVAFYEGEHKALRNARALHAELTQLRRTP